MGTLQAMAVLSWTRLLVAAVPFGRWSHSFGGAAIDAADDAPNSAARARKIARRVERAAARLPFTTKCLPRAMALSWILRRRGITHALIVAVRPQPLRGTPDSLHAWVEVCGETVLGELPGPWIETLRLGPKPSPPYSVATPAELDHFASTGNSAHLALPGSDT